MMPQGKTVSSPEEEEEGEEEEEEATGSEVGQMAPDFTLQDQVRRGRGGGTHHPCMHGPMHGEQLGQQQRPASTPTHGLTGRAGLVTWCMAGGGAGRQRRVAQGLPGQGRGALLLPQRKSVGQQGRPQ